jgi:hypothetical protein
MMKRREGKLRDAGVLMPYYRRGPLSDRGAAIDNAVNES